jgi:hypothetical protein
MSNRVFRPPRSTRRLFAVTLIACLTATPAVAQHGVPQSVLGNGGNEITGTNYGVRSTVGQPLIGVTAEGGYVHLAGYWYNPGTTVTGTSDDADALPTAYQLFQNYPNPFNPVTTIRFALPRESRVTLAVYDVGGRLVATLLDRDMSPGYHTEVFDGAGLASGVYFYRLRAGVFIQTRKLVVLK